MADDYHWESSSSVPGGGTVITVFPRIVSALDQ